MNKKEFLKQLSLQLQEFVLHTLLIPELLKILKNSGRENAFLMILITRLRFLSEMGVLATKHQEFEPLADGIYSMHLASDGFNIRILYGFLSNRHPALLLAFYEREGHQATNYSGKIKTAKDRLRELEDELL